MVKTKANPGAITGTERYPMTGDIPKVATPKIPADGLYGYVSTMAAPTVPSPNDRSNSQDLPMFNVQEGFSDSGVTHEQGDVGQGR